MSTALEIRSLISKSGELELSLVKVAVPEPYPDQVVVRVESGAISGFVDRREGEDIRWRRLPARGR